MSSFPWRWKWHAHSSTKYQKNIRSSPGCIIMWSSRLYKQGISWLTQRVSKIETRLRIPNYLKTLTDNSEHYSWQFTRDYVVCCVYCLWCTHVVHSLHKINRRRLLKFVLLDRSLMIGWRENSWNPERVSSVFTFVSVRLSVCVCVCFSVRELRSTVFELGI